MAQDPSDAQRVYLAAGRCPECVASGVYVSTDFGQTWAPSLIPSTPGAGFTHPSGRIRIGLTRSAGATVLYASVLDANNEHTNAGIYRPATAGPRGRRRLPIQRCVPKPPPTISAATITDHAGGRVGQHPVLRIDRLYKSTDGGST
jgi:hypothetical protein